MQLNLNQILISTMLLWYSKGAGSRTFRGFTKTCSDNSPGCMKDFAQSILTSFLDGVPELEIESLDPFVFENVELKLPGGLVMEFVQGQSTGFKKCIIESMRNNRNEYEVILRCNLNIEGKYRSAGRMLMFPVNGEGDAVIICDDINIKLNFELVSKASADGNEHLAVKKFKSKHTFEGQVHYNLTNIFKGNPELSKVVLEFMNSNWRMVAEEFGNPIVNYGISVIFKRVEKLLRIVPIGELILR